YLKHFSFAKVKALFTYIYTKKRALQREVPIKTICGEIGGDICEEFENKFGLREILNLIEPSWNPFIESIKNNNLIATHEKLSKNEEIPFLAKVSLYMSFLRCFSPTMRKLLKQQTETMCREAVLLKLSNSNNPLDKYAYENLQKGNLKVAIGN